MNQSCLWCKKEFQKTPQRRKLCSDECKQQHRLDTYRRYAAKFRKTLKPGEFSNLVRPYRIKHRYNITAEEYDSIMASTGGKCFICGMVPKARLVFDHCHETGKPRKPLCNRCNMIVGVFEGTPHLIDQYWSYIEEHKKINYNKTD